MGNFTQDGRFMKVTTPLGKDILLLDIFEGTEHLSRLFHFKLGMLAEDPSKVKFDQLLGQKVTVTMIGDPERHFNGIVCRISQGQRIKGAGEQTLMVRYEAEVVPQFWLLGKKIQSRIFQQKSVPDILKDVLKDLDTKFEIQGTYEPRDYCSQYHESDFDFASRLMEEEGIYYFFKHTEDGHKMVIADTPQSHPDLAGAPEIKYEDQHGGVHEDERIDYWVKSQEIRAVKQTLWDHTFEMPDDNLEAKEPTTETIQVGTIAHKAKVTANSETEIYDFPGRYAQRFDGIDPGGAEQASNLQKIFTDNARTAKVRIQEEATPGLVINGHSYVRNLMAGHKFKLKDHFDADGAYVVTEVEHTANIEGAYFSNTTAKGAAYTNKFHCIPSAVPFRPTRKIPKARVEGTQTAVVVGPSGEEIFPDKYGRVKVQFRWDRDGKKDEKSSCWVRVATPIAGKGWGMIHIPRIGQEVIVAFEEGDPDQPVIVGSVFNADQMPPYKLPDNKTQTGFKTRSSLGGGDADFNELRFEDLKGSEEIYFHAQKDFNQVVENNQSLKVGSPDAPEGSQTTEVYKDRTETVKTGNETLKVDQGNRDITVATGDDKKKVSAGTSSTEAGTAIELKVGGNSIKIDQSGITIKGIAITVEGSATLDAKSPLTTVNGDGTLTLKGGVTMIN